MIKGTSAGAKIISGMLKAEGRAPQAGDMTDLAVRCLRQQPASRTSYINKQLTSFKDK